MDRLDLRSFEVHIFEAFHERGVSFLQIQRHQQSSMIRSRLRNEQNTYEAINWYVLHSKIHHGIRKYFSPIYSKKKVNATWICFQIYLILALHTFHVAAFRLKYANVF